MHSSAGILKIVLEIKKEWFATMIFSLKAGRIIMIIREDYGFVNPIQHGGGEPYGPCAVKIERLYSLTFPKYSQGPFKAN